MKVWLAFFGLFFAVWNTSESDVPARKKGEDKVLVFTRTEGYRHRSISEGVSLLRKLGRKNGFDVDRTEEASAFTSDNLSRYRLVVFLSTTGDVLDPAQQEAFERYIAKGGNFMGIHAAVDTEYDWPWYGDLVGAYFDGHPEVQSAVLHIVNTEHPATAFLPDPWERTDEWYNLRDLRDDLQVLLRIDEDSYTGGKMGEMHPVAWCREIGNSRSFYTAGGHTGASFREPLFERHILEGILWCLNRTEAE